ASQWTYPGMQVATFLFRPNTAELDVYGRATAAEEAGARPEPIARGPAPGSCHDQSGRAGAPACAARCAAGAGSAPGRARLPGSRAGQAWTCGEAPPPRLSGRPVVAGGRGDDRS